MKKNDKVQVRSDHPFLANKIGYFQFMGGPNKDVVVFAKNSSEDIENWTGFGRELFCVGIEDLI
jgi:hypothetical protein